ncbi:PEP-CTERM sorting domain-containing protein [Chromatium okenii]|uniref:PEP-CTERM sorting domain-containing protein n=1 Tax=Chromatium okenii TaxID=61644 RepID=UPI0026F269CD|nr:PEP-CTERM sorting domain-containing protein [Chromatium okenii]MBV5309697.1 PEP-CTERM sorting domain-containing protein [Chromatium okenii]
MFNNMTKSLLGLGGLTLAVFGTAQAYPVSAQLEITGSSEVGITGHTLNVSGWTLSNLASSSLDIIGFDFTIGDTTRHFDNKDSTYPTSGNKTITLNSGSTDRVDNISLSFSGFNRTEAYLFAVDIDSDSLFNQWEAFNTVLFNNGSAANSVFKVTFAGGGVLSMTLPETPVAVVDGKTSTYTFTLTGEVPVPGTLLLLAAGMIGFRTRLLKA